MKKLLLHTCCGPCFLGVAEEVVGKFDVTNYFYNPNIQPAEEYRKRLEGLKVAAEGKSKEVIEPKHDESEYFTAIEKDTIFPDRCKNCYSLRLTKAARFAKENKFDLFSSTLLVSPYQQHDLLKEIGESVAAVHGIDFLYIDVRTNFRQGQDEARKTKIYRQKYCGCLFSKSEAGQ